MDATRGEGTKDLCPDISVSRCSASSSCSFEINVFYPIKESLSQDLDTWMWPFASSKDEDDTLLSAGSPAVPGTPISPPIVEQHTMTTYQAEQPVTPLTEVLDRHDFHWSGYPNERLGMPVVIRGPLMATAALITGFGLGVTNGGRRRADRFRAENSHRFPTTQAGWYLYHRSKSYNTVVGGVTEGVKFGGQLAIFASVFMAVEEVMDRSRGRLFAKGDEEFAKGQRDAANTVTAGMTTVGSYILWKRMDVFAAGKMARLAFKYSLAYGLAQDAIACLKGDQPGYVLWLMGKVGRKEDHLV